MGCRIFNYLPFLPPTTLLNGTALSNYYYYSNSFEIMQLYTPKVKVCTWPEQNSSIKAYLYIWKGFCWTKLENQFSIRYLIKDVSNHVFSPSVNLLFLLLRILPTGWQSSAAVIAGDLAWARLVECWGNILSMESGQKTLCLFIENMHHTCLVWGLCLLALTVNNA